MKTNAREKYNPISSNNTLDAEHNIRNDDISRHTRKKKEVKKRYVALD